MFHHPSSSFYVRLIDIHTPGTHNSGNTNELSWRRMYAQDDNYDAFVSYARASGSSANVTREQFYEVCVCGCGL